MSAIALAMRLTALSLCLTGAGLLAEAALEAPAAAFGAGLTTLRGGDLATVLVLLALAGAFLAKGLAALRAEDAADFFTTLAAAFFVAGLAAALLTTLVALPAFAGLLAFAAGLAGALEAGFLANFGGAAAGFFAAGFAALAAGFFDDLAFTTTMGVSFGSCVA